MAEELHQEAFQVLTIDMLSSSEFLDNHQVLITWYMDAVRKFEKKVEARNILAHETAGQLAQLLMEQEQFGGHDYH